MFGEMVPRGSSSRTSILQLREADPLDAKEEYFGASNAPAAIRPPRRNSLRSIMLHPVVALDAKAVERLSTRLVTSEYSLPRCARATCSTSLIKARKASLASSA